MHIIDSLSSGGAEKLVRDLVPLLNANKKVVTQADVLLLTDAKNVFEKDLLDMGVQVDIVPLRSLRNPLNIFFIHKYIRLRGYDIVHVHLFPANYWTSIAIKMIKKNPPKLVTTEHSTHNKRREKKFLKVVEKNIYSTFDRVISISQETQNNLVEWLDIGKNELSPKFSIIENGVDIIRYKEALPYNKSELGHFRETDKLICMVGRFSEQKDQETLIRAMKYISNNVHLLLIGEGSLLNEKKALSNSLGLERQIHFMGFRSDIDRIFKTVDLIVLSSHWEGFGLVAVEGMATGKPLIASNVPGLREVVSNAGVLFTRGDAEELAQKINELLCNNELMKKVSERCQERAQYYTLDKMTDEYLNVYKELFNNSEKEDAM